MNLFAVLDQAASRLPERGAVFHGQRQICTWQELRGRALALAGSIREDHPAGARIAIASENRPEIIDVMFGVWAAECVVVPINDKLHPLRWSRSSTTQALHWFSCHPRSLRSSPLPPACRSRHGCRGRRDRRDRLPGRRCHVRLLEQPRRNA